MADNGGSANFKLLLVKQNGRDVARNLGGLSYKVFFTLSSKFVITEPSLFILGESTIFNHYLAAVV